MIRFLISLPDKKWPVLLLAFIAFAWVIFASEILFPFYTNVDDEAVYILQAQTLLQGRLTLPVNQFFDDFFAPVSVINQGDRAVFKYTPVHASFLALGQLLFGSMRAGLGFVAAGNVLLLYRLGRELYGQRRQALIAAVMFLLSPFFLVQSATFLSYSTALLLHLAFAVLLLRGQSRQSSLLSIGTGAVLGLVFFARPYDAILFAVPFGLFFAGLNIKTLTGRNGRMKGWKIGRIVQSSTLATFLSPGLWIAAGFLPILSLVLIYNYHVTGHPFRFPFLLWDPTDTIGFGIRGIRGSVLYDVPLAAKAMFSNLLQLSVWIFGGIILPGVVVWRVFTYPIRRPDFVLLLLLIIFPVGYFFFWGSYLVAITGVIQYLGPFYYLPVLVPLVILGTQGLRHLFRQKSRGAQLVGITMILANSGLLCWHIAQSYAHFRENQAIYRPFVEQKLDQALVFIPPVAEPFLFSAFPYLSNTPTLDGPVLYALNRDHKNFALLDAYPKRTAYRFDYDGPYTYKSNDQPQTALVKLERLQIDRLTQRLHIVNFTDSLYVYVEVCNNKQCETYLLDTASVQGREYDVEWLISPAQVELKGAYQQRVSSITGFSSNHKLIIAVAFSDTPERDTQQLFERRFTFRLTGDGQFDLLLPAEEWYNPLWPVAEWQRKDIDEVMPDK